MSNFKPTEWTVDCNGHKYTAIGYETRGIFGVPIAKFDEKTGDAISCTVYEIVMGFKKVNDRDNISGESLNKTEIAMLESVGCEWTGCWIRKANK